MLIFYNRDPASGYKTKYSYIYLVFFLCRKLKLKRKNKLLITVILYACWYQFKLYDNIKSNISVQLLPVSLNITVQVKMKNINEKK